MSSSAVFALIIPELRVAEIVSSRIGAGLRRKASSSIMPHGRAMQNPSPVCTGSIHPCLARGKRLRRNKAIVDGREEPDPCKHNLQIL